MTRFNRDRELMEMVWRDYRNEQGVIPMASCCGGDATSAQLAGIGIQGVAPPDAQIVGDGMVRVKYLGDSKGAIPFDFGHKVIRLGANPTHRYADVTPAEAAWLAEQIEIVVVPKADPASLPLPILRPTDVLTPDAQQTVLRPRRGAA